MLAFTSVYFPESSLFNALQAMLVRKSLPRLSSRDRLQSNAPNSYGSSSSRPLFGERDIDSDRVN
jgi:hypothetical protein